MATILNFKKPLRVTIKWKIKLCKKLFRVLLRSTEIITFQITKKLKIILLTLEIIISSTPKN